MAFSSEGVSEGGRHSSLLLRILLPIFGESYRTAALWESSEAIRIYLESHDPAYKSSDPRHNTKKAENLANRFLIVKSTTRQSRQAIPENR
jgi:hypothetical protein